MFLRADFGLSINEGQSVPRSMEIGTPGYCGVPHAHAIASTAIKGLKHSLEIVLLRLS